MMRHKKTGQKESFEYPTHLQISKNSLSQSIHDVKSAGGLKNRRESYLRRKSHQLKKIVNQWEQKSEKEKLLSLSSSSIQILGGYELFQQSSYLVARDQKVCQYYLNQMCQGRHKILGIESLVTIIDKRSDLYLENQRHFQKMVKLAKMIDHQNFARVDCTKEDDDYVYIFYEKHDHIPLAQFLEEIGKPTEYILARIVSQLIVIVEYLHNSLEICHYNFQINSFIIDKYTCDLQLIDLTASHLVYRDSNRTTNDGFKLYNLDVLLDCPKRSDLYQIGCIVYDIIGIFDLQLQFQIKERDHYINTKASSDSKHFIILDSQFEDHDVLRESGNELVQLVYNFLNVSDQQIASDLQELFESGWFLYLNRKYGEDFRQLIFQNQFTNQNKFIMNGTFQSSSPFKWKKSKLQDILTDDEVSLYSPNSFQQEKGKLYQPAYQNLKLSKRNYNSSVNSYKTFDPAQLGKIKNVFTILEIDYTPRFSNRMEKIISDSNFECKNMPEDAHLSTQKKSIFCKVLNLLCHIANQFMSTDCD